MIASVYIKDGQIYFYNEKDSFSCIGGLAYELGRPLLDFICYEPERFAEGFALIAEAFDNEYAHMGAKEPEFIAELRQVAGELQQREVYIYFYSQMLMEHIFNFIDLQAPSPRPDKEKRLFRAVKDAIELMGGDLRKRQNFMINEINALLKFRTAMVPPEASSLEYLYMIEEQRKEKTGTFFYFENPFRSFYTALPSHEIVELYEINSIDDLFRFEFIKMIEKDIFIKKCKNCGRFFIPKRRADAEYCERIYGETNRKCSEIGAMLRYEKKIAENPILEAHKKAYRRLHSRTRTKKMTQSDFLNWSEEAAKKRDDCLAGELPFEDFVAWLEQGRVRKSKGSLNKFEKIE